MRKIGIRVVLRQMEWHSLIAATRAGKYDFTLFQWSADYVDPDDYYSNVIGPDRSVNYSAWFNPAFQKLLQQAKLTSNKKARSAMYYRMGRILLDYAVVIPLFTGQEHMAVSKGLQGVKASPVFHYPFNLYSKMY